MPGKSLTPDQIAEAVTLRAAGYTVTAISDRTGISIRTLNRVFEHHGTRKGAIKDDLVARAKHELVTAITSNEKIREEAARLVADDLAHARLLRQCMAEASEHLTATTLYEAALVMRAAAAYSTAVKNTSDMLRHSLRTDQALEEQNAGSLPELVVREITAAEALQIRQEAAGDDGDPGAQAAPPSPAEAAGEAPGAENERIEEGEDAPA